MQVVVIGTGYVGLVSGVCLSEIGHEVTCVDANQSKIDGLKSGQVPIFEPGLEKLVKRNIEHERLEFTTNLEEALPKATMVFIAVGTPQAVDGAADLSAVEAVSKQIGKLMNKPLVVVVKSTVPVGTGDKVEAIIRQELAARNSNLKYSVVSNPEFLKEGAAIEDFLKPDRIIVGTDDPDARAVLTELYKPFIIDDPSKLFFTDRRSSELTKYASNAMLATRISFMNELANLCEKAGADVDAVRRGMGTDPRIGKKFLYSGPGFGGSCLPKDISALERTAADHGLEFSVLKAVRTANKRQHEIVADKVIKRLGADIQKSKVAVWGLAFKPGTDDVREAPAKTVVKRLLDAGATVVAHDPEGTENFAREIGEHQKLSYVRSAYAALRGAEAVVLLTEWSEYRSPNWTKVKNAMRAPLVFDFRNQYNFQALKAEGFEYYCIGRPDSGRRD